MQHPADANQYKIPIYELSKEHQVFVYVRDRDGIISRILNDFGINHSVLVNQEPPNRSLILSQLKYEIRLLKKARSLSPDIIVSTGGTAAAHVSSVIGCESIVFTDTEHATLQNMITFPFADTIHTPNCYKEDIGEKQVRYNGYHELSYLHPNNFKPDPNIFSQINIDRDDKLVFLRIIDWDALHDIGDSGFQDIYDVISRLENKGATVIISSESELSSDLRKDYQYDIPTDKLHDLMYYCNLFIGESATMATECAVLGTPAIFVSTSKRGYTDELENDYGLVFNYHSEDRQSLAIKKAESLLESYDPKKWNSKRKKLLNEKLDVSRYIIEVIEGGVE